MLQKCDSEEVKEEKVRGEDVKELVRGEGSEEVEERMRGEGIKKEEVRGEAVKEVKGK